MGVGEATLDAEGDGLELLAFARSGVAEGGVLELPLGKVLAPTLVLVLVLLGVGEGFGCSLVVVVGAGLLPKNQEPYMTPWASVPPKAWKRPVLKSKSSGPQLSHLSTTWAGIVMPLIVIVTVSKQCEPPSQDGVLSATTISPSEF